SSEKSYDLIFCRNLLIYLHPAARRQALDRVERLLAPEGWLCTGHAEPLEFVDPRFTRAGPAGSFLYRRAAAPPGPAPLAAPPPRTPARAAARPPRPAAAAVVLTSARPEAAPAPPAPPPDVPAAPVDLLARARQQADSGQLGEALAACQLHLARSGPSADA